MYICEGVFLQLRSSSTIDLTDTLLVEPRECFDNIFSTFAVIIGEFFTNVNITQCNQNKTWLVSNDEHLRLAVAILSTVIDQTTCEQKTDRQQREK